MAIRFDRHAFAAASALRAPALLVIAAGSRVPMPREPERPSLHLPVPPPLQRPNDVVVREHDETPSAPTRGVHVFDMV